MPNCIHLDELLKVEREVIERHISEHLWFRHIPKKEDGVKDFIKEYAWLCREIFCEYVCKKECVHKQFERHEDEQYLFPEDVDKDTDINKDHNYFEGKEDHLGL